MTKMFVDPKTGERVKTWNPVVGCTYGCKFCWARRLAEGRLRHLPQYQFGFYPYVIESELDRRFKSGLIFVSSMGDLWGDWVPRRDIFAVLKVVRVSPNATFLFLTKNPQRYFDFDLPANSIAGVTIETNRDVQGISKAPAPFSRFASFLNLAHPRKFISIEPIMDFDLDIMVTWVKDIAPEFVFCGYDNHNSGLPEPSLEKTQELIAELQKFTEVRIKTLREGR